MPLLLAIFMWRKEQKAPHNVPYLVAPLLYVYGVDELRAQYIYCAVAGWFVKGVVHLHGDGSYAGGLYSALLEAVHMGVGPLFSCA